MYMTLQELADKIYAMIENSQVEGDFLITDATVSKEGDMELTKEYAPGTVIFSLIDTKNKSKWYELSLYPAKVSKWLN